MGFQEVFNAPYFCQVQEAQHYRWAEPVPDGPTVVRMQALARETGMVLVVPVFEIESAGNYYNTAAVIDADGTVLGKYRKHHIPQVKGFWEKYYFKPGNLAGRCSRPRSARSGCTSATTGTSRRAGGRSASRVPRSSTTPAPPAAASRRTCGSWSSRPRPWRTSTSWPRSTGWAWRSTATTTSTAPATSSTPRGQFVGEPASGTDEELVVRDLDLGMIDEVRQQWAFYRDRRPEAYGPLVEQ